jgi:hypothetical protein
MDVLRTIIIPLTFLVIVVAHAMYHRYLIVVKNKTIMSRQKVLEYGIASLLAGVVLKVVLGCSIPPLILFCLITRLAWYDALLNLFRGKEIYYEGVPNRRKSGFDWFESKLPVPIWGLRLIYIAGYLVYLIFYLT